MTTDKTPATLAVDVLAVMDELLSRRVGLLMEDFTAVQSARAAVAELIEASDRALIALAQAEEALERALGIGQSISQLTANGNAEEYADLSAALARVKGESA